MAGDEVKVDPDDLDRKAEIVDSIPWGPDPGEVPLSRPDTLQSSYAAVTNLSKNAAALADYQKYGIAESQRLADTLRLVGGAYRRVDDAAKTSIDATIPDGPPPAPPAPVPVGSNSVPEPPAPGSMAPFQPVSADQDGFVDVKRADMLLNGGDQAASLRAAATAWSANATTLLGAAQPFQIKIENWEGAAAEAAYAKFQRFGGWLVELAGKWEQLAAEAYTLAAAHETARSTHEPIRVEYEALEAQMPAAIAAGGSAARTLSLKMEQLQHQSEAVRETYAATGNPKQVPPPEPRPNSAAPTTPVTGNGDPRGRGVPAREPGAEGSGAQQPGGGGQPPGAAPAAEQPAVSPMSAAEQASQGAQQGAQQGSQQGGGAPGGGQPGGAPGGGSPGAGQPGGGMPGAKGDPKLPTDPSLRPAAAGGGGSGGGGGGGVPSAPMQPAVSAETVGPAPVVAPTTPAATAGGGTASGGMAGGGMGGMAPMMGAGQGGGSGEKKRNPQLSQDEELYTEERPWTEAVIGNRVRRRGTPDDTKKESQ
ncbi:ESX-1 secretion-associated protein EspB [Mycolicibacterium vanbaalenii]|uniref:ESX-1 secretion-associated protein EspB n=1 Tax=Mycolicibacterium vanbaalenii TaxID=110539 RepID=A0A5S9QWP3_MYCVN|nr:PPE domain-containing protein [Mycolicibacterium vanbaalenii]CAA0124435.1 ESX-1 secretion-associated protein EspB [Mycolicibacterium vanbaalenii]